jgi:hypothetical protein
VEGVLVPDGDERRDMGSTIGSNRRDPEELGPLEHASCLLPPGRDRVGIAEACV